MDWKKFMKIIILIFLVDSFPPIGFEPVPENDSEM